MSSGHSRQETRLAGRRGRSPPGGPCTSGSRPPGCGVLVTVTRSAARCRRQPCLPEDAGIAQTWRCASETLLLTPSQQVHVENWRDTRPGEHTCVFIKPRARGKQPKVPATQGPQGSPQSAWSRAAARGPVCTLPAGGRPAGPTGVSGRRGDGPFDAAYESQSEMHVGFLLFPIVSSLERLKTSLETARTSGGRQAHGRA